MDILKIYTSIDSEIDPSYRNRSRFIVDEIIKNKPKKILDAGCGRGYYPTLLTHLDFPTEIIGIDIVQEYLNIAQKNTQHDKRVKILNCGIEHIPYPASYFDCIICSEVLEHVPNHHKALIELKRILKKNGIILITVPNKKFPFAWDPINFYLMAFFNTHISKNIWWLAGMWADHERLYDVDEIKKLVKKYYKVISIKTLTKCGWPFSHFLLYGIGKNLVEFGLFPNFNRFNFSKASFFTKTIAKIIRLPSDLFDNKIKSKRSVNIVLAAKKTI